VRECETREEFMKKTGDRQKRKRKTEKTNEKNPEKRLDFFEPKR
jgi:hypothetical protein